MPANDFGWLGGPATAARLRKERADKAATREKQLYGGPQFDPKSIGASIGDYQGYAREGVQAFGEQLQPEILKDIGSTLGGLNSIGALRSGGTTVALNDLTRTYADRVGVFARGATLDAMGLGTNAAFGTYGAQRGAFESDRATRLAEEERKRQQKSSWLKALGSVLGAGVGFAVGGVPGAAVGAGLGG